MGTSLNTEYISVKEDNRISTGGSQEYFKGIPGFFSKYKQKNACGMVALGDTLLYLGSKEHKSVKGLNIGGVHYDKKFLSVQSYREYIDRIIKMSGWVPTNLGLSCILLSIIFTLHCIRFKLPYYAYWGVSRRRLYSNICRMLEEDIPVILCIPFVINPLKRKSHKANMYQVITADNGETIVNYKRPVQVNSHFVTVLSIVSNKEHIFYRVSSWGKIYDIDVEEYDRLLKSVIFGGTLGNALIVHRY